jgi:ornithine carbamoyltransferase (EC 2.1.3.3)
VVRDLCDIDDLSAAELTEVVDTALRWKREGHPADLLAQQTLAMVFEKPSTRTRVSFETGMTQLGGHAIFLGPTDIQLGHGEPVADTAAVLGRYADLLMARLFDHADLETMAEAAEVPVINGLTDDAHPCQTLADLMTIREHHTGSAPARVTWVGDANNVARSFIIGAAMAGIEVTVCTPPAYGFDAATLARAEAAGAAPTVVAEPAAAVADADFVYTDVWISMGQEDQRAAKLAAFEGYQVDMALLSATDAQVLHCLPAHRGEEITDAVLRSDRAIVFEQAENRLHAQKALMAHLSASG